MANVYPPLHPHPTAPRMPLSRNIPFQSINHVPSPLAFGFGFSGASTSNSQPYTPVYKPSPPSASPSKSSNKRRHEPEPSEEDAANQDDEMMARSPSPDRPKRLIVKRARTTPSGPDKSEAGKGKTEGSQNTPKPEEEGAEIDVGVLLATLPPQSLLPILTNLVSSHPALKPVILSLIPSPSLDTAISALAAAANKLRDAYPYAQPQSQNVSFGFGSGGSSFGMSDTYIRGRIRPAVAEFSSTALSYLSYFTPSTSSSPASSSAPSATKTPHPSDTFTLLHTLAVHIHRFPPTTRSLLGTETTLLARLDKEWENWVNRVDAWVNREGRMFGEETVRGWERGLEEMAGWNDDGRFKGREVRDRWLGRVGWLIGRTVGRNQSTMEEDEEL